MSELAERLAELERLGLSRRLRMISGPQGPTVLLDGKPVLLLCSNNYLGLADHPKVREAAADAAMRWGVGAGASRLVSGSMTIHRRLEERLASFEGTEAALLFGSGYLANLGVIGALAGPGDVIFSDELNHASIVDGCRLSRAEVVVYRHRDIEHLDWSLRRSGERRAGRLIVTDSVFSMDGDIAPLAHIAELAQIYSARVVVDEAHATGSVGPDGRGAVAAAGLEGEIDVVIGTLGKALGSYGAYACASSETIQFLVNTARPLIFSTAPGPPAVAGALAALELIQERPHRIERLRTNARTLRRALAAEGFPVADSEMQIVPLIVGGERDALRLCGEAIERGVFAQAIRPPTVPAGTSRLRLTAMASHTPGELRQAAQTLGKAARRLGLEPEQMLAPAPDALEEIQEIETALVRAERLSATVDEGAATPFDFERESGRRPAIAAYRSEAGGREAVEGSRDDPGESVGAATELFDFERESSVRAA
ncbi:MAG TPA: 8-amino-7-oxononanoate synthase [Solirubrobacteraceae bacterium]|jgi:glycine C-acetyltransferase/8-amino-7-oxononanoate synthase|nr:8-amino-7-oxononanoate synthase [Solirubrobacteraceae bacterium]